MAEDLKALSERQFRGADACLTAVDIIGRYATDVDAVTETLIESVRPERSGARICELGFGLGWLLEALEEEFHDVSLVGLDQSPGMAAHVRELLGPKAMLVQGDMDQLPFADGSFDTVVVGKEVRSVGQDRVRPKLFGVPSLKITFSASLCTVSHRISRSPPLCLT